MVFKPGTGRLQSIKLEGMPRFVDKYGYVWTVDASNITAGKNPVVSYGIWRILPDDTPFHMSAIGFMDVDKTVLQNVVDLLHEFVSEHPELGFRRVDK